MLSGADPGARPLPGAQLRLLPARRGAAAPRCCAPGPAEAARAASPPLRYGRCGGRRRDGRLPLAPGLCGLQGGRPRQDVLAEEVERGGHVELGCGVRHLRHLPGAGHG